MEQRSGNEANAQEVYRQSMRESFSAATEEQSDFAFSDYVPSNRTKNQYAHPQSRDDIEDKSTSHNRKREFEVSRWDQGSSSMKAEIMFDGSIEGKVPKSVMNRKK